MYRGIGAVLRLILAFLGIWFSLGFALPLLLPFALGLGLSLAAEPLVALLCPAHLQPWLRAPSFLSLLWKQNLGTCPAW